MGGIISSFLSPDSIRSALSFVAGEAKYIWGLKSNIAALLSESEGLIKAREDLLSRVSLAEQRTTQVEGWLERVQKKESEVGELLKVREQETDRLCLGDFCSNNLISSYNFGKRVATLKQEVIDLKDDRGKIKGIAGMVRKAAAVELAVEQTVIGQESKFGEVWRCITEKDNKEGIIGLRGQGGVGKTTLLKQVNNNFLHQQHHFDVVIWVVVSREPKLEKIQEDIGKRIGFSEKSWKEKTFKDKASDISDILSKKKFVLLLDDLWQHIDLVDVGVPLQSVNTGSKIVFTTRSIDVCTQMNATNAMIEVSTLALGEAWKLFEKVVGRCTLDSNRAIPGQARTLVRECRGLPLALKTVAGAMAGVSNPEEWVLATEILEKSASSFTGMEEEVFSRLKFSYDKLSSEHLRSCLLYCCLFPEDFEIPKADLIDFWISEGFLDDLYAGYTAIRDLLRACLLEEGDGDDSVKMHDLIRDMALWIACKIEKKKENFLVRTSGQGAPKTEDWEGVKRVSLIQNCTESLSEIPNCPSVQTFLLDNSYCLLFNDGFFQSMPSLRVLSLRRSYGSTDLVTVGVSSLLLLQHLDLSETNIRELPQELKALVNLRYLNLEEVHVLSRIPHKLISSFLKLQVFRMRGAGLEGIAKGDNVLSENAVPLMKELFCLVHLNFVTLTLRSSHAVQFFFETPKLVDITQLLDINFCKSPLLSLLQSLSTMKHLKDLRIYSSLIQDVKIEVLKSGFHSLRRISMQYCNEVKDLTWLAFAPNLKFVYMVGCEDVEEIISVEKLSGVSEIMAERNLFAQLEFLILNNLDNLKSICRDSLLFPKLKTIEVQLCKNLKKLPLNSSSAKDCKVVIKGSTTWWEELQWEDQATQNAFSTSFVSLYK